MSRSRCAVATLVVLALSSPAHAAGEGEGRYVELFAVRGANQRDRIARIDLDALPQRERRGGDPQYDGVMRMRGVPLGDLLARGPIPAAADLAVLRFDNGLQIPIAFRDPQLLARLEPFVVRANASDRWTTLTPGRIEETRRPPTDEDLRRVSFHGNKVAVSDPGLAGVLPSVGKDLKPWLYADSLFAIDFIESRAWEAQLDAGPATAEGRRVYLGTCRFCHAVGGVGGALGWDFVHPVPIYSDDWIKKWKAGAHEFNAIPARTLLSIHVRHRTGTGGNRTMPALRGMKPPEVQALWDWLQAVALRSDKSR